MFRDDVEREARHSEEREAPAVSVGRDLFAVDLVERRLIAFRAA